MKKRKILKRGLASLLAVVLAVGLLPMMPGNMATVKAAGGDKTIAGFGTGVIKNPTEPKNATDGWKGSYVYFGTYNGKTVKYRVLDSNTSVFGGTTMLLDCDSVLWAGTNGDNQSSAFDDSSGWESSNIWASSSIRTYLNGTFLTKNFSSAEQSAIASSTKSAYDSTDGAGMEESSYVSLDNDKIFFLDAKEATNTSYGYSNKSNSVENRKKTGGKDFWWLRSAGSEQRAAFVSSGGNFNCDMVISSNAGVSPALNIDLSSVLFSSVIPGTASAAGAEYKLTLADEGKTIKVTDNEVVSKATDGTITVPYTYTDTATADKEKVNQISVMITDKSYTESDAAILYYGALQGGDISATTGTGTFVMPSGLDEKVLGTNYRLYILAEHTTGTNATDCASAPVEIASIGAPTANPVAGTYTENQSVTLTSSTEGATIYYTTDGSEPTLTGGVPGGTTQEYTAPIAVTGTEGQSITTVIKAMAVKNGMQDSSVETFTYTIQLPVSKYTITATAGANGTISPSGTVKVTAGSSQTFTISPSSGYVIDTLKVDGLEVTAATSYTFSDVSANHTIEVTFKQESQTPNPVDYDILDGANSSWTQNTDGNLSIRGSGAFSKFVGVKVDGILVDGKNYTVKEGSTIVTLKTDYLNTLSVGTHTFEILWTDGSASTTFTVVKNTSDSDEDNNNTAQTTDAKKDNQNVTAPKTGDNTPVAWLFTLFILSGAGFIITAKKHRVNTDSSKR